MDGREGTEALAPFIKFRQPPEAWWHRWQMRTVVPVGGVGGGWEERGRPSLIIKTKATYSIFDPHIIIPWLTIITWVQKMCSNFFGVSNELPDKLLFTIRSQTDTWMCAARPRQMVRKEAAESHMDVNLLAAGRSYSIWIPISTGVCYSERWKDTLTGKSWPKKRN